jgi:methylenetetrahydrofolate dehydrogenase (NADP+) / methenyltetrahydrofolate cyclohydrolase
MAQPRDRGVRLDGRGYAERLAGRLRERVEGVEGSVGIATLLVGDDEASAIYQRRIDRGARLLGIASRPERLGADATFGQVVGKLAELDVDPEISGILVLRPLPRHLPEARILRAIPPHKDVEAQHPENAGLLALGTPRFVPSTPAAAFVMLDSYMLDTGREIETAYDGLDLVVVGRSSNVGKPAAILGLARNATVISCHKHTDDAGRLAEHTLLGDILIIAVGSPGMLTGEMVRPGAIVIDIGINPVTAADGSVHLVGDVDFDSAIDVAEAVSPVPGGVGPITDAWVLHNAILAAERSAGAGRQADSTHLVETLGRFAAPMLGRD